VQSTMKFGEHLKESIAPEYGPEPYLDYGKLDGIIRDLSNYAPASADLTSRQVSLTMPPPTNARGLAQSVSNVTEEAFIQAMDAQLQKVESFTLAKATELRQQLASVESQLKYLPKNKDELIEETDDIAEAFLRLEKYVNINFMGFHKILKKHDKHVPANPCKVFMFRGCIRKRGCVEIIPISS